MVPQPRGTSYLGIPVNGEERREILTNLRVNVRRIDSLKRQGDYLRLCEHPHKSKAQMGIISSNLLRDPAPLPSQIGSLPTELLTMIVEKLYFADRVALALSCKAMALMVASNRGLPKSITKNHRLAVLIAVRSFMPACLRLCCLCAVYRPAKLQSYQHKQGWSGNSFVDWTTISVKKVQEQGPRCPACYQREWYKIANGMNEYMAFKKKIDCFE